MIRKFLHWAGTAPAEARAQAATALARAYACAEFGEEDQAEAVSAMFALLDDPSPAVRRAIAQELAASPRTPPALATALAADQPDIAERLLEFSPVLATPELVDAVAIGGDRTQSAVARRAGLDAGVAAALCEVAGPAACRELCRNETATILASGLTRLIERFGHDADMRAALLARADLPATLRHDLVAATARSLAAFVTGCGWLGAERAARTTQDALDQAGLIIAAETREREGTPALQRLVRHLRLKGRLTPALMLRAVVCGHVPLFEAALADLSGMPLDRVSGLARSGRGLGFQSLYAKAGLPAALRPAFVAALQQASDAAAEAGTTPARGRIGRVLSACLTPEGGHLGSVTALLRRLDAQAAREEARSLVREVMTEAQVPRLPRPAPPDGLLLSPAA